MKLFAKSEHHENTSTRKRTERIVSELAILYFLVGLVFGVYFAWYYHWEFFGYFSPNFFTVVFTWPYQALGFVRDIMYYGPAGKPI